MIFASQPAGNPVAFQDLWGLVLAAIIVAGLVLLVGAAWYTNRRR